MPAGSRSASVVPEEGSRRGRPERQVGRSEDREPASAAEVAVATKVVPVGMAEVAGPRRSPDRPQPPVDRSEGYRPPAGDQPWRA
jgi:hypothetical protein